MTVSLNHREPRVIASRSLHLAFVWLGEQAEKHELDRGSMKIAAIQVEDAFERLASLTDQFKPHDDLLEVMVGKIRPAFKRLDRTLKRQSSDFEVKRDAILLFNAYVEFEKEVRELLFVTTYLASEQTL